MARARRAKSTGKPRKVFCGCGCEKWLSERAERNHRQLKARPRIKATAAYRKSFMQTRITGKSTKRLSEISEDSDHEADGSTSEDRQRHSSPMIDDGPSSATADFELAPDLETHMDVEEDEGLFDPKIRPAENIAGAQRTVWPDHRYAARVEDYESDEESEQDDDRDEDTEDDGWASEEGERNYSNDEDDEDDLDPELTPWDLLNEKFIRQYAELHDKLTPMDKAILKAYAFKVDTHLSRDGFEKVPFAFAAEGLPSAKRMLSRVAFISGFEPVKYDCCPESCCCFVGPHASLTHCPYCKTPRHDEDGKPRKVFTYLPLIPRLVALYSNKDMANKMMYRAHEHKTEPGMIKDVFDSWVYRRLLGKNVNVNGKDIPYTYFSDPRDIALGASTDGFAPFRRRKLTAWPIILFNYNLPPEIRFHLKYIIALGVVPGPKKPVDFDSFLYPAIEELLRLEVGVRAFDSLSSTLFSLRAYLILAFGDIPAMSLLMRMKGHNALSPCRMCKIRGLRVPDSRGTTHYVPLDRSRHPDIRADPTATKKYDPANLPLRTEEEMRTQAKEVQSASTKAEEERLAKEYGIKGVPILSYLSSLSFPDSFPYDFMHLIWENLVKNLILLWTDDFKGLDEGQGAYKFARPVWEAIAKATSESGDTIPYVFGPRLGNPAVDKSPFTADAWSLWTLYVGPVLLQRKFRQQKYYKHFIELVKLLRLCLQFEYSMADIAAIRKGFIQWVNKYEEMYYQYSPERLSACPLTVHGLLHIADSIEKACPVWAAWAFPTERYCGHLQPAIKSRRFPWASIDRYVVDRARLTQVKLVHDMDVELSLKPPPGATTWDGEVAYPEYPSCVLQTPHCQDELGAGLRDKIIGCLCTRFEKSAAILRRHLPARIHQWGKVRRVDGGDMMHASMLVKRGNDRRDASFVRYEVLVDKNARHHNRRAEFELQTFFGQLQYIFVIELPATRSLGLTQPTTIILAAIKTCVIEGSIQDLDVYYYSKFGPLNVVDITCVQCVVGRVPDGNKWAIVDRSGTLSRAVYTGDG